ncbi:hypothetical protein LptCag_0343 [Leptospirillum ferriphilum]|uniref:Uncharacterized protein n=1 Tax=Leptospirillum ferriphilum TaxID=178606 RepID=A0A094WCA3_9BACT|nr:hypothetical protein LptCag_0343 [Leptospirillum ferriphilum]
MDGTFRLVHETPGCRPKFRDDPEEPIPYNATVESQGTEERFFRLFPDRSRKTRQEHHRNLQKG